MARKICMLLVLSCSLLSAAAQSSSSLPDAPDANAPNAANAAQVNAPLPKSDEATVRGMPRNFLHDQAAIWTSPVRMNDMQMLGGILFVGAAGGLGAEDRHIMQTNFLDKSTNDHANTASTGLTGLFAAAPVLFYGIGHLHHDQHAEETGILGGEAILDSLAVNEVFKISSRRERPTVNNAKGYFLQPNVGFDSSFASNHAVVAWSSATVIASEYNGWLTKLTAYTLAGGVSLTRVVGRDHFPSDVFVASGVGWLIGRYVYRHHSHAKEIEPY